LKVLSNFCRNLAIRHLVNGLNTKYAPAKFIFHKAFLQLALGLTGTEDQNSVCITKGTSDRDASPTTIRSAGDAGATSPPAPGP